MLPLPSSNRRSTPNLADLRIYIWIIILHALLFYPLVPLLSTGNQPWAKRIAVILLVGVFAILHWLVMFRQPAWRTRVDRMLPFLLLNLALAALLNWLDPAYAFLFLFAAGYAFRFLPLRWAVLVGFLTAAVVIGEQVGPVLRSPPPEGVFAPLVGRLWLLFGIVFVAWLSQFARQARERQALIDQLQATQGELASAERQAGILEERARLAREIHDTLAQGLVSIVMHLEAAEQMMPSHGSPAAQHLDQARRAARDNLAEARRFVWALQPQALERDALPQALERAAGRWTDESHVPVTVSITGTPSPLPPEYEVTLLRAEQEALANVGKHAQAHQVNVTLSYMDDRVMMDVNDNGRGFDPTQLEPEHRTDGFGLAGMRQRVERLGGRLSIESAEGEGTTLVVEIPLVPNQEKTYGGSA